MSANPFADLMDLKKDENYDDTAKYVKTGEKERERLLPKYGIPREALRMPSQDIQAQPSNMPNQSKKNVAGGNANPFSDFMNMKKSPQTIDTFLGKMPANSMQQMRNMINPETINEMVGWAAGSPGVRFIGKGLGKVAISPLKVIGGALKGSEPYEQSAAKAAKAHEIASKEYEQAAQAAQRQTGKSGIGSLEYGKTKAESELAQNPNVEQVGTPDQAKEYLKRNQEELGNTEKKIGEHLNKGAVHDVQVAAKADKLIGAKKKEIGNIYDSVENDLANKNITIPNTDTTHGISNELLVLIKKGEYNSPEANQLLERLGNIGKDENIPARDYLSTMRTARDYAHEARRDAYKVGITDEARQAAFKRADELEEQVNKMKPILEKGIGEESSELLKQANERWSSEISPIQKNKIYNQIKYEGRLPTNIMKELRGTGTGMKELREIIKNDPELLRNVVGQRFANAPHKLHEIGELEKEYVERMPELKEMLGEHKVLTEKIAQTEKAIPEIEKTSQKLSRRNELQESINKMDERIKDLKEKSVKKYISLSDKVKTERELADMMKKRYKNRKLLLGIAAGTYAGNKLNLLDKLMNAGSND